MAALDDWLHDPEAPNYLLVAAQAGRGKTALLVRWVNQLDIDMPVVFVPISIRFGTSGEAVFYRALADRLATLLGEELSEPNTDARDYFREKVLEFFYMLEDRDLPCLVVLDGLDETTGWRFSSTVLPEFPPPRLKVVVAARILAGDRDHSGWLMRLGWGDMGASARVLAVPPLSLEGIADVLTRTDPALAVFAADPALLAELTRLTDGDPLLLTYYVKDLQTSLDTPVAELTASLAGRSGGFGPYFESWLTQQGGLIAEKGAQFDDQMIKAILLVLACAHGPIPLRDMVELVRTIHNEDGLIARDTMDTLSRFVIGDGAASGYTLSHPKLRNYLREEHFGGSGDVDRTEAGFLDWGASVVRDLAEGHRAAGEVPGYLLRFYAQHLADGVDRPEQVLGLTSDGWRQAWESDAEGDGYRGFQSDVESAFTVQRAQARTGDSKALAACYRCALILTAIDDLGTNLPDRLLSLALRHNRIALGQALHFAERHTLIGTVRTHCALLREIPPERRGPALQHAFSLLARIQDDTELADGIVAVSDYADQEMLGDLLRLSREIKSLWTRARTLAQLSAHLDDALEAELLREIGEMRDFWARCEAIAGVAAHIGPGILAELSADLDGVGVPEARAPARVAIALRQEGAAREAALDVALADVAGIRNPEERAGVLVRITQHLPPDRQQAAIATLLDSVIAGQTGQGTERAIVPMLTEAQLHRWFLARIETELAIWEPEDDPDPQEDAYGIGIERCDGLIYWARDLAEDHALRARLEQAMTVAIDRCTEKLSDTATVVQRAIVKALTELAAEIREDAARVLPPWDGEEIGRAFDVKADFCKSSTGRARTETRNAALGGCRSCLDTRRLRHMQCLLRAKSRTRWSRHRPVPK